MAAMYASTGQEQKMAQEVLTTLKEHPDSWTKVGAGRWGRVGLWSSEMGSGAMAQIVRT